MSGSVKWCRNLPVSFQDRAVRDAGTWDHKKAMGQGEHLKAHTARWTGGFPGHRRLGDWEGLGVEPKKRSGRDSKTGLFEWHSRCSGIFSVTYWNLFVIPKLEWAMFFQVHSENEKKGQCPRSLCTYLFCSTRAEKVTQCAWRRGLWSVRWEMESSFSSVTVTWKKLLLLVFSGLNCGKD